jgi:hypothetical protein
MLFNKSYLRAEAWAMLGIVLFVLATLMVLLWVGEWRTVGVPHPPAIEEDSPGWNCETMGNKICGEGR